jgi:hypothetical protein
LSRPQVTLLGLSPERDYLMSANSKKHEPHLAAEFSYTVDEFAEAERISRACLYQLWARGEGPQYYLVGNRRRISQASRGAWHASRKAVR